MRNLILALLFIPFIAVADVTVKDGDLAITYTNKKCPKDLQEVAKLVGAPESDVAKLKAGEATLDKMGKMRFCYMPYGKGLYIVVTENGDVFSVIQPLEI